MLVLLFSPSLDISSWVLLIGGTTWARSSHSLCESPWPEPIAKERAPGRSWPWGTPWQVRVLLQTVCQDTYFREGSSTFGDAIPAGKGDAKNK